MPCPKGSISCSKGLQIYSNLSPYQKGIECIRKSVSFFLVGLVVASGVLASFYLKEGAQLVCVLLLAVGQYVRFFGIPYLLRSWSYISQSLHYVTYSLVFAIIAGSSASFVFFVLAVPVTMLSLARVDENVLKEHDVLSIYSES